MKNLHLSQIHQKEPKRGSYAFQTDLLVTSNKGLPLVVIETKYGLCKIKKIYKNNKVQVLLNFLGNEIKYLVSKEDIVPSL